jgi:hypothetical protein
MRRTAIGTAAGVALLLLAGTGFAQDGAKDAPKEEPKAEAQPKAEAEAKEAAKDEQEAAQFKLPGSATLTLGGQVMVRGDYRRRTAYTATPTTVADPEVDSSGIVERLRLSFDLKVNEWLRAKAVIQDSRGWGTEGTAGSVQLNGTNTKTGGVPPARNPTDLYEGWFEATKLFDKNWSLKVGRMMVPRFGDQRLFSDLIWSHFPRSWDGVHTVVGTKSRLHGLATILTEVGAASTATDSDNDYWNFLVYWEHRTIENFEIDVYLNIRADEARTYPSETGVGPADVREDATLGGRYKFKALEGQFWTTGELVVQGGRVGGDDIFAWAGVVKADYKFSKPEAGALNLAADFEYAYASGDTRPTDGKINTFDPLMPFQHFYHGHADQIRWSNVHAVKLGTRFNLGAIASVFEGFTFHTDLHGFWLASRRDAWYSAGGATVRRDPTRTAAGSGAIGSEIDIYIKGTLWKNLGLWTGYSHFFPGRYARHTAPASSPTVPNHQELDQDWVFLMLTLKF